MLHVCDMLVSTRADPMEFDRLTLESRFFRENALPNELLSCIHRHLIVIIIITKITNAIKIIKRQLGL